MRSVCTMKRGKREGEEEGRGRRRREGEEKIEGEDEVGEQKGKGVRQTGYENNGRKILYRNEN